MVQITSTTFSAKSRRRCSPANSAFSARRPRCTYRAKCVRATQTTTALMLATMPMLRKCDCHFVSPWAKNSFITSKQAKISGMATICKIAVHRLRNSLLAVELRGGFWLGMSDFALFMAY